MSHTKEQANAEIEAALPVLVGFDMPSTRHMSEDEREGAIGQMLADLWMLAKNDGCIAAAWAYEFCVNLQANGQWRPIETSPKDGTKIVVLDESGCPDIVRWSAFGLTGTPKWRTRASHPIEPTHWMPLPEPPRVQPAAE